MTNDFPTQLGRAVGYIVATILSAVLIVFVLVVAWRFCVWIWPEATEAW